MISGATSPARPPSTIRAVGLALLAALAGAALWALAARLSGRQYALFGCLIGIGAGFAVARYRPGHRPTLITGAALAVLGCALGTLLGSVLVAMKDGVSAGYITGHIHLLLRAYPHQVGWFGLLFWLLAAVAAIWTGARTGTAAGQATEAGSTDNGAAGPTAPAELPADSASSPAG